jgi:hypothetical protein
MSNFVHIQQATNLNDVVTAPEIDLLALDDPAPVEDNAFDAFHSAPSPQVESFDAFQSNGTWQADAESEFDAFQSATVPSAMSKSADEFSTLVNKPTDSQTNTFDAFGGNNVIQNVNNAFGNMTVGGSNNISGLQQQQQQQQQPQMMMGGNQWNSGFMGGGSLMVPSKQQQHLTNNKNRNDDDDDFGDFDDRKSKKTASNDPLSNLISLDGLAKNKKKEDKTTEPIAFNDAAKSYIQSANQNSHPSGTSKVSADIAFSGVDGLHKTHNIMSNHTSRKSSDFQTAKPVMNDGGGVSAISTLGVTNVAMSNRSMGGMSQQHAGMMGGMGHSQQVGMMNSGMMSQPSGMMGGMGQSQQGGMMNSGMMTQPSGMMGGMGQGQQGGMMNSGMMSQPSGMMGGMGQSQQGGMMNSGMMSQPSGMMGGMGQSQRDGMMSNAMGGQPMGGAWQ